MNYKLFGGFLQISRYIYNSFHFTYGYAYIYIPTSSCYYFHLVLFLHTPTPWITSHSILPLHYPLLSPNYVNLP